MSDLLKIESIVKKNGDIKAFPLLENLKDSSSGIQPWGDVTIAVDAESVRRLWNNDVIGMLYIIGKKEWEKESGKGE